jgi:hypothetical protein
MPLAAHARQYADVAANNKITEEYSMKNIIKRAKEILKCGSAAGKAVRRALANRSGESYVDTAIKILIAVVIGALLLAGLYTLFGTTVLPTLVERIQDMFNYNGS